MKTLRLRITAPTPGAYRVALFEQDSGNELASDTLPTTAVEGAEWSPEKIEKFFESDEAGTPNPKLKLIGEQLGRWLVPEAVKPAFDALRANGLHVLLDIQPPELARLPWELVRLGDFPDFLDAQASFARFHAGAAKATVEWPLRVMVLVGAAVEDDIGAEAEIEALERELHLFGHSIDREIVRRPSKSALFDRLKDFRPHVLIFIGHCDVDRNANAPALRFQLSPPGEPWNWTPERVAIDLNQLRWVPCLVVLNACHTKQPSASFQVSDAFIRAGVSGCIAMQGDVRGDLAGVFSARVMHGLCDGEPLDIAVANARREVSDNTELSRRDWAFPVLSLAASPERLIPARAKPGTPGTLASTLRDVSWFVDRRSERRKIRSQLAVGPPASTLPGVLVLTGPSRCGKSHLAKWCLEQFAIVYRCLVRYVPVVGSGDEDFLAVLRRIRGPAEGADAMPAEALHPFHWRLNALLSGHVPTAWPGGAVADEGLRYDPQVVTGEHATREICAAFVEALRTAAAQQPMVIVLDQFVNGTVSLEPSIMKDLLVPYVIRPLQEGRVPRLLMMLVMDEASCARYGVDLLVPSDEWIRVAPELPEAHERVTNELFWYPPPQTLDQGLRDMVQAVARKMKLAPGANAPISYVETLRKAALVLFETEENLRASLKVQQMR